MTTNNVQQLCVCPLFRSVHDVIRIVSFLSAACSVGPLPLPLSPWPPGNNYQAHSMQKHVHIPGWTAFDVFAITHPSSLASWDHQKSRFSIQLYHQPNILSLIFTRRPMLHEELQCDMVLLFPPHLARIINKQTGSMDIL